MSLPSNQVTKLLFSLRGRPFTALTAKNLTTTKFAYSLGGAPFVAGANQISTTLTEYLTILDSESFPAGVDSVPLYDDIYTSRSITLTEYLALIDSETAIPNNDRDITVLGTVFNRILVSERPLGTVINKVGASDTILGTVHNNILANNLVAVTNATAVDNPTATTLILGGQTIYSHPETLPPNGLANARCYINYLCTSLFADQQLSNFFNWGININGGIGTWRTLSINDFGTMGAQVSPFGLSATITQKGREKSQSSYGYLNGGILGVPTLNKPVAFLYAQGLAYTTMNPNQSLTLPDPSTWKTYGDAARQIAFKAGVSVNFAITDYPVSDLSFTAGMAAAEALTSLAESIGAKLRWNGSNQYTIVYPNKALGLYTVPDCCLIQAMSNTCYLDVKTGIYNPGIYAYPSLPIGGAGISTLPNQPQQADPQPNGSFNRQVQVKYSTNKLLTPQDPPVVLDLPFDYENAYIQVVTVTDGGGLFVTTDPTKWFLLQDGFSERYIGYNDIGGSLQLQLTVDWTLFPQTNTDALDGHMTFQIGISIKQIAGEAPQSTTDQQTKQTFARTWQRFRFIPTCQYNITCIFSGAIPLPGMAIKAAIGDYIIGANGDVIIEDVSFSNPGILNITAIQWSEISYYDYLPSQP